jgi:lipoprotein-releasing system permease protein
MQVLKAWLKLFYKNRKNKNLTPFFCYFCNKANKNSMKFEFFIARRQMASKDSTSKISSSLVNVAVFGIALCIAVMIVSISILTGFKNEIRNKVIGFGSHIQIVNYDSNTSYETQPINKNQEFLHELKKTPGIKHVQEFATKAGIIKTKDEIQGVVLKGVGPDFDWSFFKKNLVAGKTFKVVDSVKTNEVIISRYLSRLLKLKVGDDFAMYFVQNPPRVRKFKISGIYETSVEEMDKTFVLCDIGHVIKLNNWDKDEISGFEINVGNFDKIDAMTLKVNDIVGYSYTEAGNSLRVTNIKDKYPQIFDWLNLQDMNVTIILILMLAVSGFNMISGLLILILDRTQMIGILKAIGSSNKSVRRIFIMESFFLILKGLFWGNLFGIGLCLFQKYTGLIKLNATTYYIDHVPINLNISHILVLNIGTILITIIMLILPSFIISKFSPAETIRYNQ